MTTAASRKTRMSGGHFLWPFSQWKFSVSEETGNSLFAKDVCNLYLFRSPTPTLSSLPFCTCVHNPRDSIRAFHDRERSICELFLLFYKAHYTGITGIHRTGFTVLKFVLNMVISGPLMWLRLNEKNAIDKGTL